MDWAKAFVLYFVVIGGSIAFWIFMFWAIFLNT